MSQLEAALLHQITAARLPIPEREYRFHPKRKWRLDFCWPDRKPPLAVEVEGGLWVQGRHNRAKSMVADMEKYNELSLMGYTLLRVPGDWVKSGRALNEIERALRRTTK